MAASPRRNPTSNPYASELETRIADSGLVQPATRKAKEPTPWDKLTSWIDAHMGTKHVPKPVMTESTPVSYSPAQEDSILKRSYRGGR